MTLTYPPSDTLTGTPFGHTEEIVVPFGASATAVLDDHPSPLGITAVQVPDEAYEATLALRSEDGTRTLFSTDARALAHYHQERGHRYEVPIVLKSGERLSMTLDAPGSGGTETVRFRALRPEQLARRKEQILSAVGTVPRQAFAAFNETHTGGATEKRVTVPTGEWVFNRVVISVNPVTGAFSSDVPQVTLTMGGDRNEIIDVPLGEAREFQLPLLRVKRRMKLRIEGSRQCRVSLFAPLYQSVELLDLASN
jgi:hypothetical protein